MPGIVGIVSPRPAQECQARLDTMLRSMCTEAFYVSGSCAVPEMGVYCGWVAHEGSFAAQQSAATGVNGARLLFAGECFPSRNSANPAGPAAGATASADPAQLLQHYQRQGEDFFPELNGLFSGLLIDRKRQCALLFNDRYSAERVYVHEREGELFFASEARALLRVLPELRQFDEQGLADFLSYGCTLDNRTLFRGIHTLPGASLWTLKGGAGVGKAQYFTTAEWEAQPVLSEDAFEEELAATFNQILPPYCASPSPVGISLTGGLDTRMIMSCLPETAAKPVCYTFAGASSGLLDLKLAARVAGACGLEHHALRVGDDFLTGYGAHLDSTVLASDGCAGAMDAHEIYLNAQARALSPVRLTGNFGSEILRSMSTFKPLGLAPAFVEPNFQVSLANARQRASSVDVHPVTFAAFREMPWRLFGTLAAGRSQLTFRTPYLDNALTALAYRAPSASRRSAQASLQLVHAHNLDLAGIPTDRGLLFGAGFAAQAGRRLLAEITFKLDYLYSEGMPRWLTPLDPVADYFARVGALGQHKFLLYRRWFGGELAGYVGEVIHDDGVRRIPHLNHAALQSMFDDHRKGRGNYAREIHLALTLEAIDRLLLRA